VHVSTPLAVCEARDPKGFYGQARRGELADVHRRVVTLRDARTRGPDASTRRSYRWQMPSIN
jgi:hypothetical protein